jgi:peptidoglycan/LPS O-acetylase OafA/YrhL
VHLPLIPAAMQWAGGSPALFWFIYLALSLVMALAIHLAVEQPFLRIKHELTMIFRQQKQVPQGASTV